MEDTYQCAVCKGVFSKGWSDEEAAAELAKVFVGVPIEETEIVCDDCYEKIGLKSGRN